MVGDNLAANKPSAMTIDEYEINRIKAQRRLKQQGLEDDDVAFIVEASPDPDDDDYDSDDYDDDDRHDGAVAFEPFHMKREMKHGSFDKEGNYVEAQRMMTSTNREMRGRQYEDAWLSSLNEQSMAPSKHRNQNSVSHNQKPAIETKPDLLQVLEGTPMIDIIKRLTALLEPGETPVDAIRENQKTSSKRRRLPGISQTVVRSSVQDQNPEPTCLQEMGVSDLAHVLTVTWQNVYYMTKEDITKALANARTQPLGEASSAPKKYEYKWVNGDGKVYGPSTDIQLLRWIANDYISDANPVLLRRIDSDGKPVSEKWVNYKETDVYTFLNKHFSSNSKTVNVDNTAHYVTDSAEDNDLEDILVKRHRRVQFTGINRNKMKDRDSPVSDDDPDIL